MYVGICLFDVKILRSLPDLNRSSRFCRPVPSPSAKRPLSPKRFCKSSAFPHITQIFFEKKLTSTQKKLFISIFSLNK